MIQISRKHELLVYEMNYQTYTRGIHDHSVLKLQGFICN